MSQGPQKADARARGSRLAGKVALVTGAGDGIGRGCALMFARQGASVCLADLSLPGLEQTRQLAQEEGLSVTVLPPADLTQPESVQACVGAAGSAGQIDILVNAAATAVFKPLEALTPADWRRTLSAEVDSVFLVCQAAWPLLKHSGRSAIINFASVNAYMALPGSPALAHCAGKGAVLAMTRQLAMEGGPFGIRANTISPGFILTGATAAHLESEPAIKDSVLAKKMIKRVGLPEDIAWCATYLASDEASWVTASDFGVDGGARAW